MPTDRGGLQEECCVLGTPCLTQCWNTERPVTLKEHGGASVLVGNSIEKIRQAYNQTLKEDRSPMHPKPLGRPHRPALLAGDPGSLIAPTLLIPRQAQYV